MLDLDGVTQLPFTYLSHIELLNFRGDDTSFKYKDTRFIKLGASIVLYNSFLKISYPE